MSNRRERRARSRIQRSAGATDARYWRDRNDAVVGLLQAIIEQAGGRIVISAEYTDGPQPKRTIAINRDLTSVRARTVLTFEKENADGGLSEVRLPAADG